LKRILHHPPILFLWNQLLPAGIFLALGTAMLIPAPGRWFGGLALPGGLVSAMNLLIVVLFFLTGLSLDASHTRRTLGALHALATCLPINLVGGPLVGLVLARALGIHDGPVMVGFIVASCVPPTLSSGIVITGVARGNTMLAVLLTVTANAVGILTAPAMIGFCAHIGTDLPIDTGKLFLKLFLLVLVPFALAMIVRQAAHGKIGRPGPFFANMVVILIVWTAASEGRNDILRTGWALFGKLVAAALLFHTVLLAALWIAGRLQRLHLPELKATVFVGSQKTLPLSVTILSMLGYQAGAVACIVLHMTQIMMDSLIASHWKVDKCDRNWYK
jgi:sodium/bile acid cotransporter 7